ncbi:MAG: type II toxin-antitoxin system mRNA interferase toxin, RelE/StbE family [Methanocellales archaeon]|nr:type II toxin-antitoxin system mRNA interferase toxin, RelE/StbE family [Methanocellales archaeon]
MTYKCRFSPEFEKDLRKIKKKDKVLFERICKKIEEILESPEVYKPLRYKLKGLRRAHIGSFVVIFQITGDVVEFLVVDHHDRAYKR